jgi:hypothetical protein
MSEPLRESLEHELAGVSDLAVDTNSGPNALDEARHAARFGALRLKPSIVDGRPVPGLVEAGLSPDVPGEMETIAGEIERLNAELTTAPSVTIAATEMRAAMNELTVPLRWLALDDPAFDGGQRRLKWQHASARDAGALAVGRVVGDAALRAGRPRPRSDGAPRRTERHRGRGRDPRRVE